MIFLKIKNFLLKKNQKLDNYYISKFVFFQFSSIKSITWSSWWIPITTLRWSIDPCCTWSFYRVAFEFCLALFLMILFFFRNAEKKNKEREGFVYKLYHQWTFHLPNCNNPYCCQKCMKMRMHIGQESQLPKCKAQFCWFFFEFWIIFIFWTEKMQKRTCILFPCMLSCQDRPGIQLELSTVLCRLRSMRVALFFIKN